MVMNPKTTEGAAEGEEFNWRRSGPFHFSLPICADASLVAKTRSRRQAALSANWIAPYGGFRQKGPTDPERSPACPEDNL